jgi:hypothetical protein
MLMRSIDEVRELLGPAGVGKTDEEIAAIRERAYDFAFVLVSAYRDGARKARREEAAR